MTNKKWWKVPNNFEKFWLLCSATFGFITLSIMFWISFICGLEILTLSTVLYYILTAFIIAALIIRKGMKYSLSKDGMEVSYEDTTIIADTTNTEPKEEIDDV